MKWFFQYLFSPIFAAALALAGNYYLIEKPSLEKEYTKIGVDIMLNKQAPSYMRKYAGKLLEGNSPVAIEGIDSGQKLDVLIHNIPATLSHEKGMTIGEILARYMVLSRWISDVKEVCENCINEKLFNQAYKQEKEILNNL